MPKKKKDSAKKAANVSKKTEAQKKAAKSLKRPAAEPKTGPIKDIKLGKEQTTPSASSGFELPTNVPPQLREEYRQRFEEQQLSEIGREASPEELRKRSESIAEIPITDPEQVKKIRGATEIPFSERPLTPKPEPEAEPTPGQQRRKQAGRLPRGTGGTGVFRFGTATRDTDVATIKELRDVARLGQKGITSTVAPHVTATAVAHARKDHETARSTGKVVNGISPDDPTPTDVSVRGTHHERLAEVIHGYGVTEGDVAKLPGTGDVGTKVSLAWQTLKKHERSKVKVPRNTFTEGATHWQHPQTGEVKPLSAGNHPAFYTHENETEALVRGKGEAAWKALNPVREGWDVMDLRGQKTWIFRKHPGEAYKGTHQVRSLFHHIQNTLKGEFPELSAPSSGMSPSEQSRVRSAERVREKFVVMKPEDAEAATFSKKATKDSGFLRERGRTKRTMVAGADNVTVTETPETEFVTGPKRIEPRRPKVVQEESGRRVVRPRRRDESKKVGYISQPLTVTPGRGKQFDFADLQAPEFSTKTGPSGEILRSKPTITKTVVPDEKALKKSPKSKKTRTEYKVTPGLVDQPLPGMESYGYSNPETPESKFWHGKAQGKGRWINVPAQPATPGSARPAPQGEFAGETGMEQLKYLQKKAGGRLGRTVAKYDPKTAKAGKSSIPKETAYKGTLLEGTDTAATRNIPQQLELPGIESPGYAGAQGQQFRRVSQATRELQLKSQQGAVPGVAADLPKGVAPKKSTRSFKGRR